MSCTTALLANDKSLGKLNVGHLEAEGVPICLGAAATELKIETAVRKRRCAANRWKRIWKAKRVNRLCKPNSEAQNLTMTGIHLVQVYEHTAQGVSTARVNAMCRNLKMGTMVGRTQACAISTVAWFFGERRVPQTAARVQQVSEWIWQVTSDAGTKRQVQSLPFSARFWKRAGSQAHQVSGKGQTSVPLLTAFCSTRRRSSTVFLQTYGNADMEKSGWALAQCRYGERYHNRIYQEGQVSANQRKIHGCACELHLPADDSIPFQCSVCNASRGPWPSGSTSCVNDPATAWSITHA